MSTIPNDLIPRLSAAQTQIWQTVSLTASDASGKNISFSNPLTVSAKTSDLQTELAAPMLVIQFALASLPENAQVVMIPQQEVLDLAGLLKDELQTAVDENLVADIRPTLESIVQGICLAAGNVLGEPVVATGLSLRFQIPSLPPNLQRADEVIRTQVAITADGVNGAAIWIMDAESALALLGLPTEETEEKVIFGQFGDSVGEAPPRTDEVAGLDLLMDIPLEISVELGRVKMLVKDVVELGTGSIVEIDKAAGEPVDVLVNGRVVARGEVVVIEDNFGVRITEILNPQERLQRLSEVA